MLEKIALLTDRLLFIHKDQSLASSHLIFFVKLFRYHISSDSIIASILVFTNECSLAQGKEGRVVRTREQGTSNDSALLLIYTLVKVILDREILSVVELA